MARFYLWSLFFRHYNNHVGNNYNFSICQCADGDNITEFTIQDGLWCCKTSTDNCTIEKSDTSGYEALVKCNGSALNLSEQCFTNHNKTYNYYPYDKFRDGYHYYEFSGRSHINDICKDNRY